LLFDEVRFDYTFIGFILIIVVCFGVDTREEELSSSSNAIPIVTPAALAIMIAAV
jgi:hypothetical protein